VQKISSFVSEWLFVLDGKADLLQKSCLQSKPVTELQDAYENDAYLSEGLGSVSHVGINNPKTHSFWPYVDGTVIAADPSTRGPQVPMVIGYSMIIPIHPISNTF